jgi:hypothetical protein
VQNQVSHKYQKDIEDLGECAFILLLIAMLFLPILPNLPPSHHTLLLLLA